VVTALPEQRILVSGAGGFLGRSVLARLGGAGARDVITFTRRQYDLRRSEEARAVFVDHDPITVAIHVAADVGGIGYSRAHPARQFYNNVLMNTHFLHEAHRAGVSKFVGVGSVCEYPARASIPFREEDVWNGYPVVSNDAYGLSKRMMLAQSFAYHREFGFNAIHLLPINLYGPGDTFDPARSHVIPALIRKFWEAREAGRGEVEVWGSGKASREFLYVEDAAEAIQLATELYDSVEPVNIGTGEEIRIADLAELIAQLVGFTGKIRFDPSMPDGQARRQLDTSRAFEAFGFRARTPLVEGLKKTVEYYAQTRSSRLDHADRSGSP
jgi:GDP-L-fucose synthase